MRLLSVAIFIPFFFFFFQSREANVHVQEDGGRSQTDTLAQAADHEQVSSICSQ